MTTTTPAKPAARLTLRHLSARLAETGRPDTDRMFARVAFAAIKAGCDYDSALLIAARAYDAAQLYVWDFAPNEPVRHSDANMHSHLERIHAERFPFGKCAEDILARAEGRPSRWGTAEHHMIGQPVALGPAGSIKGPRMD